MFTLKYLWIALNDWGHDQKCHRIMMRKIRAGVSHAWTYYSKLVFNNRLFETAWAFYLFLINLKRIEFWLIISHKQWTTMLRVACLFFFVWLGSVSNRNDIYFILPTVLRIEKLRPVLSFKFSTNVQTWNRWSKRLDLMNCFCRSSGKKGQQPEIEASVSRTILSLWLRLESRMFCGKHLAAALRPFWVWRQKKKKKKENVLAHYFVDKTLCEERVPPFNKGRYC